jgi:hypothetical protein
VFQPEQTLPALKGRSLGSLVVQPGEPALEADELGPVRVAVLLHPVRIDQAGGVVVWGGDDRPPES